MASKLVSDGSEIVFLSSCSSCKHKDVEEAICTAFQQGIPPDILSGKVSHTEPYPGDNGIQYEPIPKTAGRA